MWYLLIALLAFDANAGHSTSMRRRSRRSAEPVLSASTQEYEVALRAFKKKYPSYFYPVCGLDSLVSPVERKTLKKSSIEGLSRKRAIDSLVKLDQALVAAKVTTDSLHNVCVGKKLVGPMMSFSTWQKEINPGIVVPWDADAREMEKLLLAIPSKVELKKIADEALARTKAIHDKYGIDVRFLGHAQDDSTAVVAAKVLPLLDALEKALEKPEVRAKKIEVLYLLTFSDGEEKIGYTTQLHGTLKPKMTEGRVLLANFGDDQGGVVINTAITKPEELEALLSSDKVDYIPSADDFKNVDELMAKASPSVRKHLSNLKEKMESDGTDDRRQLKVLSAQARDKHGLTYVPDLNPANDAKNRRRFLEVLNGIPKGEIKIPDGLRLSGSKNSVGQPLGQWVAANEIVFEPDAKPEEIKKALDEVPTKEKIEALNTAEAKHLEATKKIGLDVILNNRQHTTLSVWEKQNDLLERLATRFSGYNGDKPPRVWLYPVSDPPIKMSPNGDSMTISLDATDEDLAKHFKKK